MKVFHLFCIGYLKYSSTCKLLRTTGLVVFFGIGFCILVQAQPCGIMYDYDAAGQRILRSLCGSALSLDKETAPERKEKVPSVPVIAPNPVQSHLSIRGIEDIAELVVIDGYGRHVLSLDHRLERHDLSQLAAGIYLLRITKSNHHLQLWKFLKL
jgi:hypothetical protein